MGEIRIMVLANSRKNHGRCLAGVEISTGKWVRAVQDDSGSALPDSTTVIEGGKIRPGNVVSINVGNSRPLPYQPENYLCQKIWNLEILTASQLQSHSSLLESVLRIPSAIGLENSDRIPSATFSEKPIDASLKLVAARDVQFYSRPSPYGSRKNRVKFLWSGMTWDLANTDDWGDWDDGKSFDRALLCISLGEVFNGSHYKLVSGVIPTDTLGIEKKSLQGTLQYALEGKGIWGAIIQDDNRAKRTDWFYQANIGYQCAKCSHGEIQVFRSHYEGGMRLGQAIKSHYFALYCKKCNQVSFTNFEDKTQNSILRSLSEEAACVKDICPLCISNQK